MLQSFPTLCNSTDCSPPGASVHGLLQARILECSPPPGDLPDPGIKSRSPMLTGRFFTTGATWETLINVYSYATHNGQFGKVDGTIVFVTFYSGMVELFKVQRTEGS